MALSLLRYLAFVAIAIVGPGVALQRWLRLAVDAAIVLPLGAAFTAATYALAQAIGQPWLFPTAVVLVDLSLLRRGLGTRAEGDPPLRGALPAGLALVVFLAASQYGWNRTDSTGAFLLDPMGDHPLHVGATYELTLPWPPQVPGLAGVPLVYHIGADLIRAAALRWAAVSPYDQMSRFEVTLWAVALVLVLRAVTARLGAPPLAVSLVGFAPLAGDFVFLLAPFLPISWWGDLLRGNLLMSLLFDNPVVLGLAMALAVPLALSRYESGEGKGWVAVAGLLAIAATYVKVFMGAQLALGLLWSARKREHRAATLVLGALTAAAAVTLAGGSGGERVEVLLAPLELIRNSVGGLGLNQPSGLRLVLWFLPWLILSLGLRVVGLPSALSALRWSGSLPAIVATIALSGWPLGLLFHAAARDLAGQPLPSALIYLVEQSGCVLWIFTAMALAARARDRRPALVVALAALACLPSVVEMAWRRQTQASDRVSPAVMGAMRALEQASRPGDLVLQRPGFDRPPLPVILAGRRVLLEGYTPYLTQFAPATELRRRRKELTDLFRAESSEEARNMAGALGGSFLCLYGDQSLPFAPGDWLRLVYDHPEVRVYRIETARELARPGASPIDARRPKRLPWGMRLLPWALVSSGFLVARFAHADIPVVELQGVVHAVSAAHVVQAIEKADAAGAPLLIVRTDTPGGFDTAMRQIVDKMINCRTPVVVFVGPSGARAASAGFVILMAADVAAMAPGTNTGAAHPVSATGQMDEVMSKKVTSDAAAYIRSKAERRGRNVEMAEKAVVESKSFTEKEALELELIDLVAADVGDLVRQLDGREVKRFDGSTIRLALAGERTVVVRMDWRQGILSAIASPEILFLLLLGALAGLGTEISHPGLLFPGILGVLSLILFLFASQIIPINGAGVLLVLLAFGLFAAEVKVHSYGLLTVGGGVAMMLGAMMLVDSPLPELRMDLWTLWPVVLFMAAGTTLLVRMVVEAQRRRPVTGEEGLVGLQGTADSDLGPEGWVRVRGERWMAVSEERVAGGEPILVLSVQGLRLKVRKGA